MFDLTFPNGWNISIGGQDGSWGAGSTSVPIYNPWPSTNPTIYSASNQSSNQVWMLGLVVLVAVVLLKK